MSANVDKWAPIAAEELARVAVPLPLGLILGVIWTESRGKAGLVNPKSGASGLMQVMPKTLAWYNQFNPPVSLDTLRSAAGGREQIRVGVWVLAQFWKGAYRYLTGRLDTVPTTELARVADLFYVAGPGAVKRRLDKLPVPFYWAAAERWPEWNALPHVPNVFRKEAEWTWDLPSISAWLESSGRLTRKVKEGAVFVLIVLILAWKYLLKPKEKGASNGDEKKE